MTIPANYSFTRYLSAKKSVDDRALNRYVWEQLASALPSPTRDNPLRVLEAGAGIGTMVERALDWELLSFARYTAIDNQDENIRVARQRLAGWTHSKGMRVDVAGESLILSDALRQVDIDFITTDMLEYITRPNISNSYDLLVAHAFLDLVDVSSTLADILAVLAPGGVFYFSLNFDGLTLLEPPIDPQLDETIQRLYHITMDERRTDGRPSGDSRTGRHLFGHLERVGAQVLAAGASDWVVHPLGGGYPADEAYFLHFIIHTIYLALAGHPELHGERLMSWTAQRHAQIERGELVYIAHQLDILGKPNA